MDSYEYFYLREEARIAASLEDGYFLKRLNRIDNTYMRAYQQVQTEINDFYAKYAGDHGLTMAEAQRKLSSIDMKEYEAWAAEYVATKNFSPEANQRMAIYNATMRVNRLEALNSKMGMIVTARFGETADQQFSASMAEGLVEYKRLAGILGESLPIRPELVDMVVVAATADFYGADFSMRIWQSHDKLTAVLQRTVAQSIIGGKNPREMASELQKLFKAKAYEAKRLAVTELAKVQSEIQKAGFERFGYEEYNFIAEPSACDVCLETQANNPYKVSTMRSGLNMAPIHPNCRCSVAAFMDRAKTEKLVGVEASKATADSIRKAAIKEAKAMGEDMQNVAAIFEKVVKNGFRPFGKDADLLITQGDYGPTVIDITDQILDADLRMLAADATEEVVEEVTSYVIPSNYSYVDREELQEIRYELRDAWAKWMNENELIEDYFTENYVGNGLSYDLNQYLRTGDVFPQTKLIFSPEELTEYIEDLDKMVETADKIYNFASAPKDLIADRWVANGFIENILTQNNLDPDDWDALIDLAAGGSLEFVEKGYASTSLIPDLNVFLDYPIKLTIQIPQGTKLYITDNVYESEAILDKGTKFRVLSAEYKIKPDVDPADADYVEIVVEVVQ